MRSLRRSFATWFSPARRAAARTLVLLAGASCLTPTSACSDASSDPDSGAGPGGSSSGGPLPDGSVGDGAAEEGGALPEEGQPVCTKTGYCWELPYVGAHLTSIHGASAGAIWAVGANGTILASRSGGAAWRKVEAGTDVDLHAVFALDATHAYAAGENGTVLTWDGKSWSATQPVPGASLRAVWAADPAAVWAVGWLPAPNATTPRQGVIARYDGTSWTRVSGAFPALASVHGASASSVWAVGGPLGSPSIHRWNGAAWAPVDLSGLLPILYDRAAATGAWGVAEDEALFTIGGRYETGTIVRWKAGTWTLDHEGDRLMDGGFGVGPGGVPWALGDPPRAYDEAATPRWKAVDTKRTFADVRALWSTANKTIAAGDYGLLTPIDELVPRPGVVLRSSLREPWTLSDAGLFRLVGTTWKHEPMPGRVSYEYFSDAVQQSDTDVDVITRVYRNPSTSDELASYRVHHFDGATWSTLTIPPPSTTFRSPHIFARTTTGERWFVSSAGLARTSATGTTLDLPTCAGASATWPTSVAWVHAFGNVVLAGVTASTQGAVRILRFSGNTCAAEPISGFATRNHTMSFRAIAGTSADDVWVVVDDRFINVTEGTSEILHFTGGTWSPVARPSGTKSVTSIAVEAGRVWLVTDAGAFEWTGTTFAALDTGTPKAIGFAASWTRDAAHPRLLANGGMILTKR